MADEIKPRNDLSLQPQDLAQSYVDASFNQGSSGLAQIAGNSLGSSSGLESPIIHPGALGARTTPGDLGFAYADTPQATVFIQKKQWVEQEWVYVTDDTVERKGKIQEEFLKIAYANLISRKLDLLNEHELMTKFSDSSQKIPGILQSSAGGVQTSLAYAEKLNPNQLMDLLASAGNPVTKYYTEQVVLKDPDQTIPPTPPKEIKGEFIFKIANKVKVVTKDKAKDASRLRIRLSPNLQVYLTGIAKGETVETTGKIIKGSVVINVASRPDNLPSPEADLISKKYPLEEWWEIDLKKLKPNQLVLNKDAGSGDPSLDTLEKIIAASNGGVGYIPRFNPSNKNEQFAEPVDPLEEVKETIVLGIEEGAAGKTIVGKTYGSYQNVFNGVIELANISNISTSINNLSTPGSASLELENPNNLLTISDDDIEIALGTYNIEDERLYTEQEIEDIKNSEDKTNTPKNITYTDPTTNKQLTLYNHKGKFYTQHAYQLVTNSSLGAKANFSTSGEIVELKQLIAKVETHITNLSLYKDTGKLKIIDKAEQSSGNFTQYSTEESLQYSPNPDDSKILSKYPELKKQPTNFDIITINLSFPPASDFFGSGIKTEQYDLGFAANKAKVTAKIKMMIEFRKNILTIVNNLINTGSTQLSSPSDPEVNYRRTQLRKYFLNRTIFEVYDRIFIWMSSPSRSTFKLENGTIVSEAPGLGLSTQLELQKIQEIISLIKQLNNTILKIAQQAKKTISSLFTDEELTIINEELFNEGISKTYNNKSKIIIKNFNNAPTYVDELFNFVGSIFDSDNAPKPDPTINILDQAIKQKIKEFKQFKQNKKENQKINEAVGSFDLKLKNSEGKEISIFDASNQFVGVDEQQIQVFQGVITKISRRYSQGQFKITINCEDNLQFLSRSRFTIRPALQTSFREARAELDDPIYREVRNQPATDELQKTTSIPNYTGRWKTGILSTSARIFSSKDENLKAKAEAQGQSQGDTNQAIPETERIKAGLPNNYAFIEPFLGADPATIISLLVTGMPFDVSSYILNTVFGGSFNKKLPDNNNPKESKDGEIQPSGPIENVRTQILGQLRRFGDFQPFIDQKQSESPKVSEENKKNISIASATTLAASIAAFARSYVLTRKDLMQSAYQTIQNGIKNKTGIWSGVNEDNASTILSNIELLPTDRNQIKINPNVLGDAKIDFFVKAAIKGIDSGQINAALKEKNSLKLKAFIEDTPQGVIEELLKDSDKYSLNSSSDSSIYFEIIEATNARLRRGIFFKLSSGNKDDLKDLITPKSTSPEDIALRKVIAQLRNTELDEDGKFIVSGTPLQATKPSIMFKQKNNYLVVSDEYFKSPNLIDYVEKISNPQQHFIDDYKTVIERCKDAANKIDWEFYADTQGHIRFKEPTYNRTLLKHLLEIKNIDTIFKSTFIELFKESELNAAQKILIYRKYVNFLEQTKIEALNRVQFLLQQSSQLPIPQNTLAPSALLGLNLQALNILQYIIEEDLIPRNRLREIRALIRLRGISTGKIDSNNEKNLRLTSSDIKAKIEKEIQQLDLSTSLPTAGGNNSDINLTSFLPSGDNAKTDVFITTYLNQINNPSSSNNNFIDFLKQIGQAFLGASVDEEALSKTISENIENCISACIAATECINELKITISQLEQKFANVLQDITDEKYIHVIPNSIIIDESYNEDKPRFVRIDVYAQGAVPTQGQFASEKENESVLWAGAVDYDLWRMYGYFGSEKLEAPFLKTSGQAVLYAYQLMARQYSKILSGSITVRGDSKYQLGDTVFIEDENIYYYITQISHNFTYGAEFKTTLTLEYGRRPGYYIPYPFNILGGRLTSAISRLYGSEAGDISQIIKQFNKEQEAKSTT